MLGALGAAPVDLAPPPSEPHHDARDAMFSIQGVAPAVVAKSPQEKTGRKPSAATAAPVSKRGGGRCTGPKSWVPATALSDGGQAADEATCEVAITDDTEKLDDEVIRIMQGNGDSRKFAGEQTLVCTSKRARFGFQSYSICKWHLLPIASCIVKVGGCVCLCVCFPKENMYDLRP